MDDPMQASIGGDLQIEQRLDAYARVRLSPTDRASARMRARVMREARLAMATPWSSTTSAATSIDAARTRRRGALVRRGAGLLLAAALSLAVAGGAMAAAQAGGPLYPTRIWLETITLPANGAARADADLVRLESRIQEVAAAAGRGDHAAVAAALRAYQEIADEALLAASGDEAVTDRLRNALGRHLAVLEAVAGKVPPQASEAINRNIDRAIERNGATIDRIESNKGGPAAHPVPAAKPDKTPNGTAKPAAAPTPVRTQRPQSTPPAAEPPKGQPDPKPDKTPPGHGRSQQP
jgi:hypothetical protein